MSSAYLWFFGTLDSFHIAQTVNSQSVNPKTGEST